MARRTQASHRLLSLCLGVVFVCLLSPFAYGDEETPRVTRTEEGSLQHSLTTFENHGYFRFRADLFGNRHLFSSPSPGVGLLPPLSKNGKSVGELDQEDGDGHLTGSANIRFRWEPSLQVGEHFTAHAQLDLLDNLVLGSTPDYSLNDPYHPYSFLAEGQQSPEAGSNGLADAIRVKRAWGTAKFLNFMTISAGRMPNHWGLGMVNNDGNCLDCDYGDNVDRLAFAGEWEGIRAQMSWDFPGTGAILSAPGTYFGQSYDGTRADDVEEFVLDLSSSEDTPAQATADKPFALRWGWRNTWRDQASSSDIQGDIETIPGCTSPAEFQTDPTLNATENYECLILRRRDAEIWLTDVFLSMDWHLGGQRHFTLETEMAGVLGGEIDRTQGLETVDSDKEIWSGAGLIRARYQQPRLKLGLETGAATGDDLPFFGVNDQSNIAVDDDLYQDSDGKLWRKNRILSTFAFNRSYTLDLLLFREVIGAVTNTIYQKVWFSYDFWKQKETTLGGRVDLLYAAAMFAAGTPGEGDQLGFEPDLQIYLNVNQNFRAVLEGGVLFPLSGLDHAERNRVAEPAWTLQTRMHIAF